MRTKRFRTLGLMMAATMILSASPAMAAEQATVAETTEAEENVGAAQIKVTDDCSTKEKAYEVEFNKQYYTAVSPVKGGRVWFSFTTAADEVNWYTIYMKSGTDVSTWNYGAWYLVNDAGDVLYGDDSVGKQNTVTKQYQLELEKNTKYYLYYISNYDKATGNFIVEVDSIKDTEGYDKDTAAYLTEGVERKSTFAVPTENDYFKFTTGKAGHYKISTRNETVDGNIDWYVTSPSGENLIVSEYSTKKGTVESYYVTLDENAEYDLRTYSSDWGFGTFKGDYSVKYEYLEDEVGDTMDTAYELTDNAANYLTTKYTSKLCAPNDFDYYKFVPTATCNYNITLTNHTVDQMKMELFSENGESIDIGWWPTPSKEQTYTANSKLIAGSTYYIKLAKERVTGANDAGGEYTLQIAIDFPFTDVRISDSNWMFPHIDYCNRNKIMTGKGAEGTTTFAPNDMVTRAEFATILYRMAGSPYVYSSDKRIFPDVPDGKFYTDAVAWAYKNGIVQGYPDGTFMPNKQVARQEMAKMLYVYSENIRKQNVASRAPLGEFEDAADVNRWATEYVQWAVSEKIISGKEIGGKKFLDPKGNAKRSECATMISRFLQSIETK